MPVSVVLVPVSAPVSAACVSSVSAQYHRRGPPLAELSADGDLAMRGGGLANEAGA